ncbi:hypothetical protein [Pseudomonas sp. Fl4BN1]|uniref:hypothetical protein n=1 Tax=Pseudomonas sp. Fl4BN1 TaxID=2697651 RepID=UPI0013774E66|nr:hypothetical protein [Pseudomonas sp. Fl4BN1]NBF12693.1 hypothetical protein [Pseudomonas sp. Fl4BN1]
MRTIISILLLLASGWAVAGYDMHITRKPFWADESGPKVSFEQWLAYLRHDPQVARDLANSSEDFMVALPGESFPLWYNPQLGELYTKNPTQQAMRKLQRIAQALDARVQGDDGEFYPSPP